VTAPAESTRSEARKIVHNSLLLGIGDALAMAMGFVTTILVTDHLGDDYGVLIGGQRFAMMFLVIAEFGLAPLLIRRIAANRTVAGVTFSSALSMQVGLCALYSLVVMLTAQVIGYLPEHRTTLALLVVLSVLTVFSTTQMSLFEGLESMGRSALLVFVRAAATLAGVGVVVMGSGGLQAIVVVYIIARVVQILIGTGMSFGLSVSLRALPRREPMVTMLREAPLFVFVGAAYIALRSLDVVMLARLSGPEETARYGAALNFIEVLLPLMLVAQRSLFPAFSRLGEQSAAEGVIRDTLHVFSALLVPGAIGLALLAPEALSLYPSREFDDSANVLRLLAVSVLFLGLITVCATYLTGVGRMRVIIWSYVIALPVQIIANAVLIPLGGAEGVATATLIAQGVLTGLLLWAVRSRGVMLPFAGFARHIVAGLVMAASVLALGRYPFALVIVIGAIVYAATLLAISRQGSVERRILAVIGGWWRARR
jgi:O-antigen/teichoic acid export membrane protein